MSSCGEKPFCGQQHVTCLKPQKRAVESQATSFPPGNQKKHSSSSSSRRPVYVSVSVHPPNAYIWAFSMKALFAIHSFCFPNNRLRASCLSLSWSCSPDRQNWSHSEQKGLGNENGMEMLGGSTLTTKLMAMEFSYVIVSFSLLSHCSTE